MIQSPAQAANYKIIERLKAPDGGFDYATFDPASHTIFMVRPDFTTTVDVKSNKVSQIAHAGGDHIALPIPNSPLLLVTQRRGVVRLVDKIKDSVVAEIPAGKNPNSATYDVATKMAFAMNKTAATSLLSIRSNAKRSERLPSAGRWNLSFRTARVGCSTTLNPPIK